jgi:hypothetical protein
MRRVAAVRTMQCRYSLQWSQQSSANMKRSGKPSSQRNSKPSEPPARIAPVHRDPVIVPARGFGMPRAALEQQAVGMHDPENSFCINTRLPLCVPFSPQERPSAPVAIHREISKQPVDLHNKRRVVTGGRLALVDPFNIALISPRD